MAVPAALTDANVKLAVIDEAHHGAANSYRPLFVKPTIGLLGLTATPSRHDGMPLEFDRESYSIGFPDLIKKGIILKPEVHAVAGGTFSFTGFTDEDLESLNTQERNERILRELIAHTNDYKKIIIYVGTTQHAKKLYDTLLHSSLRDHYESISYIVGNENSRSQDRIAFIETEKHYLRSILVNVQVLTEGYDDPTVNTVVMAAPSKSKLYYMQALGRAIRLNPNDLLKKAHVVEVVDSLPNIRYRIDNRWLYADISDALEPIVQDFDFSNEQDFVSRMKDIFVQYEVPIEYHMLPPYNENDRYSLLLFKQYRRPGHYIHYPLIINNDNRPRAGNLFNFISERMAQSTQFMQFNYKSIFSMLGRDGSEVVSDENIQKLIYDAMTNACILSKEIEEDKRDYIRAGHPWITFIAFHFRSSDRDVPVNLLDFITDMINRSDILDTLITKSYESGSYLVKLPLPLNSYIGRILTASEFDDVRKIITALELIKNEEGATDHRIAVKVLLGEAILPIEIKHSDSLVLIARESLQYYYPL